MNILKNIKNIVILQGKASIFGYIFSGTLITICLLGIAIPHMTNADLASPINAPYVASVTNEAKKAAEKIHVIVSAYSSTESQTDSTPFITASGKRVKDGIIANNLLPFGTKVKIPSLYGDKIFTVEDRMNKIKSDYHIDIWMENTPLAINFGKRTGIEMEILEN